MNIPPEWGCHIEEINYLIFGYTYHSNVNQCLNIVSSAPGCSTFRIKRMTSSMRKERYELLIETISSGGLLDRNGESS